jgi:hypothetical protein
MRKYLLLLCVITATLYSCKKNKNTVCRLSKQITSNSDLPNPEIVTYVYSGDKLVQVDKETNLGAYTVRYKRVYEYDGNRISRIFHHYTPAATHKAEYTYNTDNTVQTIKWYSDTALFRTDTYSYTGGRLMKISARQPAWMINPVTQQFDLEFTYTGNDITRSKYTALPDPVQTQEYIFMYSPTPNHLKGKYDHDLLIAQGGEEFMALSISEHLITAMTATNSSSPYQMNRPYNFTYRPDGLIDKVSYPTTNGPVNVQLETKYEYDCK